MLTPGRGDDWLAWLRGVLHGRAEAVLDGFTRDRTVDVKDTDRWTQRFTLDAQIQHTESTYLQFGMELGLIGMALLLVVLLSLVATLWRIRQRQKASGDAGGTVLAEVALVTWLGALAVFAVTPLMQNFLVAAYLWLVAGLAFHLDAYRGAVGSDQ